MPAGPRLVVPSHRRFPFGRLVRANIYDLVRLLSETRVALTGFFLVMLVSTLYIFFVYQRGIAESLYESFRLLTLQSGLDFPQDPAGKALFMLVPVLGLALILDSVFRFGRRLLDKGSRREEWQVALASSYQQHVVVCGLGKVGVRVVAQLVAAGHDVVVIEQRWSNEFVNRALGAQVPVVEGDARDLRVLQQARVGRARAAVICIDSDLVNIEVALQVRTLRPDIRVVLRVFDDMLDQNLEETFGSGTVFSASALAAPTFAAAAVSREVHAVLSLGTGLLGISELVIEPESLMSGFVRQIETSHAIRVLRHTDPKGRVLQPAPMRQLGTGDRVVLLGTLAALEQLRLKNVPRSKAHAALGMLPVQRPTETFHRVIVCGLGKIGYRIIKELRTQETRPTISCIYQPESTPVELLREIEQMGDVLLIADDARSRKVLRRAGIMEAYSVVAATSDDFANMQVSMAARRERRDIHLVVRMFSDVLAEQIEDLFSIHTAYSGSALAAPTLAASALVPNIISAATVDGILFGTVRSSVADASPYAGLNIAQLHERHGLLAIELRRESGRALLPDFEQTVGVGDELVVLAPLDALATLGQPKKP